MIGLDHMPPHHPSSTHGMKADAISRKREELLAKQQVLQSQEQEAQALLQEVRKELGVVAAQLSLLDELSEEGLPAAGNRVGGAVVLAEGAEITVSPLPDASQYLSITEMFNVVARSLGRFTKKQLYAAIKRQYPASNFNEKSLERPLGIAIKKDKTVIPARKNVGNKLPAVYEWTGK